MRYSLSAFASLIDGREQAPLSTFTLTSGDLRHLARRAPNISELSLAGLGDETPYYSVAIAERCAQIRHFRDTRGCIPEPDWHGCICVLRFTKDGYEKIHLWSSGYENKEKGYAYNKEETDTKIQRSIKSGAGPRTCKWFQDNTTNDLCRDCPYAGKITSPLSLGYEASRAQDEVESKLEREVEQQEEPRPYQEQQQTHNTPTDASPFPLRWHGDKDQNINRKWLVKHLLPEIGAGLVSGQWGAAKTFITIDLSVAAMTGTPFAGRPVKRKGGILFFAAEGASEIPIRLQAVIETKLPGHKAKLPFAWAEGCPMLLNDSALNQLAMIARQAADRMQEVFKVELVLIIIDTMSAAAGFKDENSSSEGQTVMNVLNELSKRTGALVVACDHFGKMAETGTRGTSAKEASADFVVACLAERIQTGKITNLRIAVRKLRSGATGAETQFGLRPVDMGVDEEGAPITTCVVDWSPITVAAPPEATKGKGWTKATSLFRGALVTSLKLHGTPQQVPPDGATVLTVEVDKVREEFNKRYSIDGVDRQKQVNNRRQAFKRARAEAEFRGLTGGREIDGKFMVWLIRPEEEGVLPSTGSSGQRAA